MMEFEVRKVLESTPCPWPPTVCLAPLRPRLWVSFHPLFWSSRPKLIGFDRRTPVPNALDPQAVLLSAAPCRGHPGQTWHCPAVCNTGALPPWLGLRVRPRCARGRLSRPGRAPHSGNVRGHDGCPGRCPRGSDSAGPRWDPGIRGFEVSRVLTLTRAKPSTAEVWVCAAREGSVNSVGQDCTGRPPLPGTTAPPLGRYALMHKAQIIREQPQDRPTA